MLQRCSQLWHSRAGHGMIPSFVPVLDTIPTPSTKLSHFSPAHQQLCGKVASPGDTCHCSPSPLMNQRILPQLGSPKNEAVRFRYIQLPLLPNKWVLSKEIQFLLFWGSHTVIVWWLFLGVVGGRQFLCWIAPFRYKEPCKAEDIKKIDVQKRLSYTILGWRKYLTVRNLNSSICLSYRKEDWVESWLQKIRTSWG